MSDAKKLVEAERATREARRSFVQKAKLYSYLAGIFLSAWVPIYVCILKFSVGISEKST